MNCYLFLWFPTVDNTHIMAFVGVKASMAAMRPIEEEPYEVSLDNHGCMNGPKTGRLAALERVNLQKRFIHVP